MPINPCQWILIDPDSRTEAKEEDTDASTRHKLVTDQHPPDFASNVINQDTSPAIAPSDELRTVPPIGQ